jgi:tight adherence protein B
MNPFTLILLIGGGLILLLLIVGIVTSFSGGNPEIDERLTQVSSEPERGKGAQNRAKEKSAPITDWFNQRLVGSSMGDRISKDLARADIKMKSGEYIALLVISSVGVAIVLWFIGRQSILLGLAGVIVGFFLPGNYVKGQQKKRLQRFDDQLPDMINLMVNGLRAGYSTMQALEAVSKEMPAPICDEFRRVVQEMQLGIPMDIALANLFRRIPSPDLDLMITAINVQREVGGNLAEILDTISYTIRERIRIKGEIRVLSAQAVYSGSFLSGLPVIVSFILYLINPEYMSEFFTHGLCGYGALVAAGLLIIIGYLTMKKLGQVEI